MKAKGRKSGRGAVCLVILEQASFAQRRIWAIREKRRILCDAITSRLDRFVVELASTENR